MCAFVALMCVFLHSFACRYCCRYSHDRNHILGRFAIPYNYVRVIVK